MIFNQYPGTGNPFDWILREAERVRNLRRESSQRVSRIIKSLRHEHDSIIWKEVDAGIKDGTWDAARKQTERK